MTDTLKPLRKNIHDLGSLLGQVITELEGRAFFDKVEKVRKLSKRSRKGETAAERELSRILSKSSTDEKQKLARAFTEFLRLSNVAEQVHRNRRRREYALSGAKPQRGSVRASLRDLCKKVPRKKILENIRQTRIELILTAHPTETQLPTAIRRYQDVAGLLVELDRPDLTPFERQEIQDSLHAQILSLWQSSLVREHKPTPGDEAKMGLDLVEEVLWHSVPRFLRELDLSMCETLGEGLGIRSIPVYFGSWMGGDRDGNPFVTAKTTREVLRQSSQKALRLYLREIELLKKELYFCEGSSSNPLDQLSLHLLLSAEKVLTDRIRSREDENPVRVCESQEVLEPLESLYSELCRRDLEAVANLRLRDLIWRLRCFGLSLLPLDIRQDSAVHEKVLSEILSSKFSISGYAEMSDEKKQQVLFKVIKDRSRVDSIEGLSSMAVEVLETFRVLDEYPSEFFGQYVISMTEEPSDVLEVHVLRCLAGIRSSVSVAPLFETPEALDKAHGIMTGLYARKAYLDLIRGRQCIMLGYSDSGKRSGKISSSLGIYNLQKQLSKLGSEAKIETIFFHGRGGSIARGGGPIKMALEGLPRPQRSGTIRVTEQGESIVAKFGIQGIAERTLELYLAGFLESRVTAAIEVPKKWSQIVYELATDSAKVFRDVIYENPRFMDHYRQLTPAPELSFLKIGSRPAKRKKTQDLDSLRAIPWVFAWTQNRCLLPAWLGVADALDKQIKQGNLRELQTMWKKWLFFRSLIDAIEMNLAKADGKVVKFYSDLLVEPELRDLTDDYLKRMERVKRCLLKVTGKTSLLEDNPVLDRSIRIRTPYVDVINILQAELLRDYRAKGSSDTEIEKTIAMTLSGISAGMRNTG